MDNKYSSISPLGIGEKERHLLSVLLQQGKQTVRASDLISQLNISRKAANLILSRLSRKGWLQRLLPGIYGYVPLSAETKTSMPEDPIALAMELFSPCYIAGWSAAEHWDFTEQIFNTIAVCSTHRFRTKMIEAAGVKYFIQHVSNEEIFGTQKLWRNLAQVVISDPHRTIIDILNAPELGAGGRQAMAIVQAYWKSANANPEILLNYAEKLENGAVFKRLGFTSEKFGSPSSGWIQKCASKITKGVSKFDPAGPNSGPIISRWNLRINVPIEDLT